MTTRTMMWVVCIWMFSAAIIKEYGNASLVFLIPAILAWLVLAVPTEKNATRR